MKNSTLGNLEGLYSILPGVSSVLIEASFCGMKEPD